MKERRKYARVKTPNPLKLRFKVVSSGKQKNIIKKGKSHTKDVSSGGMFIEIPPVKDHVIDGLLSGKNKLVLELNIPGGKSPMIIHANARWMDKKGSSKKNHFGIGVRFEDMKPADRERFFQYMLNLVFLNKV